MHMLLHMLLHTLLRLLLHGMHCRSGLSLTALRGCWACWVPVLLLLLPLMTDARGGSAILIAGRAQDITGLAQDFDSWSASWELMRATAVSCSRRRRRKQGGTGSTTCQRCVVEQVISDSLCTTVQVAVPAARL